MPKQEDFASMMEASLRDAKAHGLKRLERGEVVDARVIGISDDSVFVDVDTPADGYIARGELEDHEGQLRVKVGDVLRATVVDPKPDGPVLAVSIGRGGQVDASALAHAQQSGAPISGKVSAVIKGGLQVEVGGVRAFCPASQVELGYAADLASYEGQTFDFRVIEVRDGGRSVVVSRRALLEDERREQQQGLLETLRVGADVEGTVHSLNKHGAVIDLGGIEGFAHISELAPHRVERPEDVVQTGEQVTARVLSIEDSPKGPKVRLSLKAHKSGGAPAPRPDEVLTGTVSKLVPGGAIISTPKGDGLVPASKMGLAPGADHRRAFPPGKQVRVVLESRDASSGKLRFSMTAVAGVEERANYREFSSTGSTGGGGSLGSLGDVFRKKLGLPEPEPSPAKAARPAPKPADPPKPAPKPTEASQPQPTAPKPAEASQPQPAGNTGAASQPKPPAPQPKREPRPDPPGVVRRKKR